MRRFGRCWALWALSPWLLTGQDLRQFEKSVSDFTLSNGLRLIVFERHDVPVVSFYMLAGVGSSNDPSGGSGLAHLLERVAFKGTDSLGSKDWPAEKKALDSVEEAYDKWEAERNRGPLAEESRLLSLQSQVKMAIDRAGAFSQSYEFLRAIEENGGVGLSSNATVDVTSFACSLPSNRAELWFLLESHILQRSVLREFYKERDAALQQYRDTIENSSHGAVLQALAALAFVAHPYRNPRNGWPGDLANLRRGQARAFLDRYYVPGNLTIAIAGDLSAANAKRLAERYFGPIPAKPLPPLVYTDEPPQTGPRAASVTAPGPPMVAIGYKRPDALHRDAAPLRMLEWILGHGSSGWLHKELVERGKVAVSAQASASFPSTMKPGLFLFLLVPAGGKTADDAQRGLDAILNRLYSQKVDAATLDRARAQARLDTLTTLSSNNGRAATLAHAAVTFGDWRKLFSALDQLDKVTADDVQRAAIRYFNPSGRSVATVNPPAALMRGPVPSGVRR